MSDRRKADVAVIGGGVIGLSCAWRLAQAGRRVVLFEQASCGSGASGASLGALVPSAATHRRAVQQFQRASLALMPAFVAELEEITGIDIDYRRAGRFEVLATDQRRRMAQTEVQAACAEWPPVGPEPVMEWLDPKAASRMLPAVTMSEHGVLLCRASAHLSVDALLEALGKACIAEGVEIREFERAELVVEGERAVGVRTATGVVEADAVLAASGAWSSQLHPAIAELCPMRPAKGQGVMMKWRGSGPVPFDRIVRKQKIYLLPQSDGSIVLGSTTEPDAGTDGKPTPQGLSTLISGALALAPSLAEAEFVRAWAGPRPEPPDRRPYLGKLPGFNNLFVATGHYKIGVALAPLTAKVLMELILGRPASVDLSTFAPGREMPCP